MTVAGDRLTLKVDALAASGEGVARTPDGQVVFVPYTVPGDVAEVRIDRDEGRRAKASLVRVVSPSTQRRAADCPVFGECGGCVWQHVTYEGQLAAKQKIVEDALRRIGGFALTPPASSAESGGVQVRSILGMEHPWHYRNKAAVPLGERDGRLVAGYYARGSHTIVDFDDCRLEDERVVRALRTTRRLLAESGQTTYDETSGRGLLRHMVARVSRAEGSVLLTLVLNGEGFSGEEDFAIRLQAEVPEIVGVLVNEQRDRTNRIFGTRTRVVSGRSHIVDTIEGLHFNVFATSFFQVNPIQAEKLYRIALAFAGVGPGAGLDFDAGSVPLRMLDAYSGVGAIALLLAQVAPPGTDVLGLEIDRGAVADARKNAADNSLEQVRFESGAVEVRLPRLLRSGWQPDVVVLDPPRSGARPPVLHALRESPCRKLVYVSCNPATFARDARDLASGGYRLREVAPVDMFPQTAHVECVGLFEWLAS